MNFIEYTSSNEIISDNLSEIAEHQNKLNRLRILQAYEILDSIKPLLEKSVGVSDAVNAASHYFKESGWLGRFSTNDKVLACRRLRDIMREFGYDPGELLFPSALTLSGKTAFAYVDNPYSAAAYDIFSFHGSEADPRLYHSFTEMCDDTAAGLIDACIVPIENTSDGKLLSFYSIIDHADLKITAICDVYSDDESGRTRYALLRRNMLRPESKGADVYFEFSFCQTPGLTVDEILHAAVLSELTIFRIDSIPLSYNESNFIFHPVLLGRIENILVYSIYLFLCSAQFTPVGVFSLIKRAEAK